MISIVIPAYNEERRISNTLKEYCELFKDDEIIISLNACTDRTLEIVKEFQKEYSNLKYIELDLGAKGNAVKCGFEIAKGDYIGFADADCSTSAKEFARMFGSLGDNDGIIASRYMKDSVVSPKQSWKRILVSRMFNLFVNTLLWLGYKDTQCGAKIFKREAVLQVLPEIKTVKWAFDVDLLYHMKRDGFKIKEFPTVWEDKEYSTLNVFQAGPNMLLGVIRLRLLYSPFKFIILDIYDKIK